MPRTRQLALVSAILASTIAAIDSSAVNVALPAIRRDLGGGFAAQQWVSNAYLLTLGALILLAGSLTDRLGERRVFSAGVAGFGIGSLLCAVSPSIGVLIAARALQGVAGALLTPSALAIIVAVFPSQERGAAIGRWTAWSGIGILAGPLIGGQIVDSASWRWIFAINPPIVVITLVLGRIAVPGRANRGDADGTAPRIDWTGAGLAASGLAGISFALIEQPVLGWSDPGVWGALVAGLGLFAGFVWFESRARAPMLPLSLFASRNFSVANAQTFAMYGGIGLLGFFVTIYLQQVAGYSALKSGVTGLVPTIMMFLLSARMGRLADRYGPRWFLTIGPLFVAAGFGLMLRYGTSVSLLGDVLPALVVFAFGLSLTVAPLTATVLAEARDTEAGIASAVNNAIARTAGLISVAAVGAIVAAHYGSSLRAGIGDRLPASTHAAVTAAERRTFGTIDARALPAADRGFARQAAASASEDAFHLAMGIGSGLLVVAAIAGGVGLRGGPVRGKESIAAGECAGGQFAGAPRVTGAAARATPTVPGIDCTLLKSGAFRRRGRCKLSPTLSRALHGFEVHGIVARHMGRLLRTFTAACLLVLAVAATASAAQRRVAVGNAARIPHGASLAHAVSPHKQMRVTLSLTSRNPIAMHTQALAVATPGNPQYGHTLTVTRFAKRYGAPSATLATVRRAMRHDGLHIDTTYANHLAITASGNAATVERAFDTGLIHVRMANGRRTIANTTTPTLPASIANRVDAVLGLNGIGNPTPVGLSRASQAARPPARHATAHTRRHPAARRHIVTGGVQPCAAATATAQPLAPPSVPAFGYTSDGLASAYGLPSLYAQGDAGQGQTILLYESESLDPNDVAAFQACYGTSAPVSIVPVDAPDPVDYGDNGDGEAALDVDQIIGMAPQASIVVYEASQNDNDSNGELLNAIASNKTGKIVSISYGGCEALDPASALEAEAKVFDEMALQGQSVFASSGDTGAQGCGAGDSTLSASDPASQPTVTGVGGTSLYSGTSQSPVPYNGANPLIEGIWNSSFVDPTTAAVHQAATGGGVSSVWKMPSFQSSATTGLGVVNGYSGTGGCGSARCREVPDVSAEGDPDTGTVIYANTNDNGPATGPSQWQVYGGTSASAPLWAAFTALTNVLPSCRGLPVGDLNPSLYALAGSNYGGYFRDITAPGAFTSLTTNWTDLGKASTGVYPISGGYDLATGLGSPLMNTLAPALCATRAPVYTVTIGSPGNHKFQLGQKVKLKVPASDSGSAALTFNATGLPPGLKIGASTGIISGKAKKLGTYTVTVGGKDFATNQGTNQFVIAVVKKRVPKAHFGKATLHGLAARKAKLRFVVTAPKHRRLRSVTIHLSKKSGLSFKHSNKGIFVHAATGRHRSVAGKTKRHKRALTLRFRKTQKQVVVVIGRATLKTSRKLARQARKHSFRLTIGLSATDNHRHTTHHKAKAKVTQAKRHHKKHHHRRKHHK